MVGLTPVFLLVPSLSVDCGTSVLISAVLFGRHYSFNNWSISDCSLSFSVMPV
jgi:hypothetical protein